MDSVYYVNNKDLNVPLSVGVFDEINTPFRNYVLKQNTQAIPTVILEGINNLIQKIDKSEEFYDLTPAINTSTSKKYKITKALPKQVDIRIFLKNINKLIELAYAIVNGAIDKLKELQAKPEDNPEEANLKPELSDILALIRTHTIKDIIIPDHISFQPLPIPPPKDAWFPDDEKLADFVTHMKNQIRSMFDQIFKLFDPKLYEVSTITTQDITNLLS